MGLVAILATVALAQQQRQHQQQQHQQQQQQRHSQQNLVKSVQIKNYAPYNVEVKKRRV